MFTRSSLLTKQSYAMMSKKINHHSEIPKSNISLGTSLLNTRNKENSKDGISDTSSPLVSNDSKLKRNVLDDYLYSMRHKENIIASKHKV